MHYKELVLLQEMGMASTTGLPWGTLSFSAHASASTIHLRMGKTGQLYWWTPFHCFCSCTLPGEKLMPMNYGKAGGTGIGAETLKVWHEPWALTLFMFKA